jgi:hypothetical protein
LAGSDSYLVVLDKEVQKSGPEFGDREKRAGALGPPSSRRSTVHRSISGQKSRHSIISRLRVPSPQTLPDWKLSPELTGLFGHGNKAALMI